MKLKRFYGKSFIIGCVFLFNPIISLFDVLPDFIGCLLIATSLKEICVLDSRLENAMRQMYYLAGVSAARLLLMFFVFDMDSSWVLSCVSLLGVAELFFFLYFLVSFFGGMTYLAQRCDSENVLSGVDNVKIFSCIFCVVRTVCTVLPQLAALPELTLSADPDALKGLTPELLALYKNYAIVILFVISFIVGICWLKSMYSFMKGVSSDSALKEMLERRYGEYVGDVPMEEAFIVFKGAAWLYVVGALFCADVRFYNEWSMYGKLLIPAWVGTLIFAYVAMRLGGNRKLLFAYGALAAAQAVVGYFVTGAVLSGFAAVVSGGAVIAAAFCTEGVLADYTEGAMALDIRGILLPQRVLLVVYVLCSAVYAFTDITLVHTAKVLCFAVWIALIVRTFSAVGDHIKAYRRL